MDNDLDEGTCRPLPGAKLDICILFAGRPIVPVLVVGGGFRRLAPPPPWGWLSCDGCAMLCKLQVHSAYRRRLTAEGWPRPLPLRAETAFCAS